MAVEGQGTELIQIVALLGAGVIAVPLFKRLKLGSVLAYFMAGLIIGPFGFAFITHPQTILHVAEFGVIMLLFIIGLEMHPSRLWGLRREIFGLGAIQVVACGLLLTMAGMAAGLGFHVAFIAGMGFVLSSTAVVMQMLDERGETSTPQGYKAVSILLLEDLAIVPLLAVVAFMAPGTAEDAATDLSSIGVAAAAVIGLVAMGRWLLNPMFRILAKSEAREVMTAAALLVVLGSALLMQLGGLSMAMGAFLAGVMLSESSFRHQLEADIEPFRGLLLGLFFLAVGMSLDLDIIASQWQTVLMAVAGFVTVKSVGIYGVARGFGDSNHEAVKRVTLFAQGGEFAFVLYAAATQAGIFDANTNAVFTATVILSMALTPFSSMLVKHLMREEEASMDGIESPEDLQGNILLIGFGRFSQVVSQSLLARGFNVSIIESDVEMIRTASSFGFKVYYGDGTRLDVLHASGADNARAVLVCVNDREATNKIVELVKAEFPHTRLFARAYDRGHAMELIKAGVDFQIRETFESAMVFSEAILRSLGVQGDELNETLEDVRHRDAERLALQVAGDMDGVKALMRVNSGPVPVPLTAPKKEGKVFVDGNLASILPATHPAVKREPDPA